MIFKLDMHLMVNLLEIIERHQNNVLELKAVELLGGYFNTDEQIEVAIHHLKLLHDRKFILGKLTYVHKRHDFRIERMTYKGHRFLELKRSKEENKKLLIEGIKEI